MSRSEVRRARRRVLSYAEVVEGARRHFLRAGTIHMDDLATELAVSRATLYRLVEGRDRLLGDVLWSLAAPLLEELSRSVRSDGVDAIVEISMRFYDSVLANPAFRRFLDDERDTAMRVLFAPAVGVHVRAVEAQKAIFAAVCRRSGLDLGDDIDSLAYLYVRIIESLLYADLFTGRAPDLALMERAARAVLTSGS